MRNKKKYNEYMNKYMKERYKKRRLFYITKLGSKCKKCGSTHKLEFDHIDSEKKEFDVAKAIASWSNKKLDQEMEKCQILCISCHFQKTLKEKNMDNWKHGTLSGYRYCKCDKCKLAKSIHSKKYNEKRKSLLVKLS